MQVTNCKTRLRDNFSSFTNSNKEIANCDCRLTDDVWKLIIETKYYLATVNDTLADFRPGVTYAELINYTNKLSKDIGCFTFSNGHMFKQIVKIQKWLIIEEEYQKNFSLRVYDISLNLNFEKYDRIAECILKSKLPLQ